MAFNPFALYKNDLPSFDVTESIFLAFLNQNFCFGLGGLSKRGSKFNDFEGQ